LAIPDPIAERETLRGEVIGVDSFGNLVTNVSQEILGLFAPGGVEAIEIGGEQIKGLRSSYEEGKTGEIIALWGSAGLLEVSLKEQNLHRERGWGRGEHVRIRRKK
jgi:S-adenosylmethionine hydrolase